MKKKQVAIVGATGFTGSELVRLLHHHPHIEIAAITSESKAGTRFSDVHPFFKDIVDIPLISVSELDYQAIDLAFLALPHGVSMDYVEQFEPYDFKIIDLSGDFRLASPEIYEEWYKKEHTYRTGFQQAAYGLPEWYAKQIKEASLIANPGCYPTSVVLGVAPLAKAGLIDFSSIIADCKSGITGAGIKSKPVNHYSSVNDNFKAYGLKTHRHSIEIQEKLNQLADGETVLQFTPHLLPLDRGILSTIYLKPASEEINQDRLDDLYRKAYEKAPFVRLLESAPAVKNVRGTNYCDLYVTYDERTKNIIVITAIDNLVKGAAGQAIQNMNLLFDWDETSGLQQIPLVP